MKLHSLKIDDGEEKELCRVGIRRFGVDCTAMIQGRGYNPEVYIGGIYKLTVTEMVMSMTSSGISMKVG